MLNLLPLEFINLLEILLQSTFHDFLIQKGIVKVCCQKDKKELKVYSYCSAPECDVFLPTLYKGQKLFCWLAQCRISYKNEKIGVKMYNFVIYIIFIVVCHIKNWLFRTITPEAAILEWVTITSPNFAESFILMTLFTKKHFV